MSQDTETKAAEKLYQQWVSATQKPRRCRVGYSAEILCRGFEARYFELPAEAPPAR